MSQAMRIAIAIIHRGDGRLLTARRRADVHWVHPGITEIAVG